MKTQLNLTIVTLSVVGCIPKTYQSAVKDYKDANFTPIPAAERNTKGFNAEFWAGFIDTLIDENFENVLNSAKKNAHHMGVFEFQLLSTDQLALRVYAVEIGALETNAKLGVHNHSYRFTSIALASCMENITYTQASQSEDGAEEFTQFTYNSAFKGKNAPRFTSGDSTFLKEKDRKIICAGQSVTSESNELHRIRLINDEFNVFLLMRFRNTVNEPVNLFSQERLDDENESPELYQQLSENDFIALRNRIREAILREGKNDE
jgi:hypothetical protein